MNVLESTDWTFPVPIRYGPGRLNELGSLCCGLGAKRPLLVTDRNSRELPFVAQALDSMAVAGAPGAVFADVAPNPTDHDIARGRAAFTAGQHDAIVAIGGGSGMDAGKAISLVARCGQPLWTYDYDYGHWPSATAGDFVPLICIPTTAGTGAETQSTAMVTDTAAGAKRCVWHPAHKPATAILDPALTVGLPPNLTAWTGCDALVHAIEALAVPSWHPLCDGLAQEAMRLIYKHLPTAVRDGGDLQARGAMQVGACLAGISFLKGLGLVHAMSHMIGAVLDTQHGLTNAILLPCVLQYNRPGLGDKTDRMCRAMALNGVTFDDLYAAAVDLLDRLDIPDNLAAIGVTEELIPELAAKARTDAAWATNPVPSTVADIEALLHKALHRAR
ncbi:MAG: iron-containing alcohol dehydrogenase [Gammaproteobacteria bacterium]|nr:iron-containing alcohol dehydrogenase [Gammaproteobacteria bacterium]